MILSNLDKNIAERSRLRNELYLYLTDSNNSIDNRYEIFNKYGIEFLNDNVFNIVMNKLKWEYDNAHYEKKKENYF